MLELCLTDKTKEVSSSKTIANRFFKRNNYHHNNHQ